MVLEENWEGHSTGEKHLQEVESPLMAKAIQRQGDVLAPQVLPKDQKHMITPTGCWEHVHTRNILQNVARKSQLWMEAEWKETSSGWTLRGAWPATGASSSHAWHPLLGLSLQDSQLISEWWGTTSPLQPMAPQGLGVLQPFSHGRKPHAGSQCLCLRITPAHP